MPEVNQEQVQQELARMGGKIILPIENREQFEEALGRIVKLAFSEGLKAGFTMTAKQWNDNLRKLAGKEEKDDTKS